MAASTMCLICVPESSSGWLAGAAISVAWRNRFSMLRMSPHQVSNAKRNPPWSPAPDPARGGLALLPADFTPTNGGFLGGKMRSETRKNN